MLWKHAMTNTIELRGWKLFGLLSAIVLTLTAVSYALAPDNVQALQYMVRLTARTSFVLFLAAFTASSLALLIPSNFTKSLVRERRYLGLAFSFSHFAHASVIVAYANIAPDAFWIGRTPMSNIPGYIAYVVIALMTVTSFSAPARLIGPRAWKVLHRSGVWLIAVAFTISFYQRIPMNKAYAIPVVIILSAVLLRALAPIVKTLNRRRVRNAVV
jgi:methionine sulfoxide reductase heme-binding subunit